MTSQEREEWRQKHSGGFVTGSPISNFSCSKVKFAYPSQAVRTNPGAHSPDFFLPFFHFIFICVVLPFPLRLFSIQNKWQPVTNSNLKPCIFNKYSLKLCCMCLNLNVHIHLFSCSFFTCFLKSFFLCVSFHPLYIARESSFVFFIQAKLANQLVLDCSRIFCCIQNSVLFVNQSHIRIQKSSL